MRVLEVACPHAVLVLFHVPSRSSFLSPKGSLFPKAFLDGSTPTPWDFCLFQEALMWDSTTKHFGHAQPKPSCS